MCAAMRLVAIMYALLSYRAYSKNSIENTCRKLKMCIIISSELGQLSVLNRMYYVTGQGVLEIGQPRWSRGLVTCSGAPEAAECRVCNVM